MTRHPDAGSLAEYREGLLGRRHSARIRAHLAGCPRCASLDADLADVTTLLASSPTPIMPSHLMARLDGALAAEAASRPLAADAAGDAAPAGAGDGAARPLPGGAAPQPGGQNGPARGNGRGRRTGRQPAHPAGPGRRRPAVLGAAAAAVIVLAGAGYGLANLTQQPGGASGSSGAAAGPGGTARHSASPGNPPAAGPAQAAPSPQPRIIHSGTDYQPGTLAGQARTALGSRFAGNSPPLPAAASAQARSCMTQVTGGTAAQLVDVARYQGRPATIIVQSPSAGKPGQVWVAGPACSAQHRDILAHTSLPSSG